MRSDVLKRHKKQHSKKNESVPATNILVTNNIYNNPPSVSTSDPIKKSNKKSKINKEELRKHLIKIGNEYEEKLELGKEIYEMLGEGVVPYQALARDMKEAVDLYIENQANFRDVGVSEIVKECEKYELRSFLYKKFSRTFSNRINFSKLNIVDFSY